MTDKLYTSYVPSALSAIEGGLSLGTRHKRVGRPRKHHGHGFELGGMVDMDGIVGGAIHHRKPVHHRKRGHGFELGGMVDMDGIVGGAVHHRKRGRPAKRGHGFELGGMVDMDGIVGGAVHHRKRGRGEGLKDTLISGLAKLHPVFNILARLGGKKEKLGGFELGGVHHDTLKHLEHMYPRIFGEHAHPRHRSVHPHAPHHLRPSVHRPRHHMGAFELGGKLTRVEARDLFKRRAAYIKDNGLVQKYGRKAAWVHAKEEILV